MASRVWHCRYRSFNRKYRKKKISDTFQSNGEQYFRELETKALLALQSISGYVISTGAGILSNSKNISYINSLGSTVWLDVPVVLIAKRLCFQLEELKKRPLLSDVAEVKDTNERLALLVQRLELMRKDRSNAYNTAQYVLRDFGSTCEGQALAVVTKLGARLTN